jgi:UDP-glucose 4-epimerase
MPLVVPDIADQERVGKAIKDFDIKAAIHFAAHALW